MIRGGGLKKRCTMSGRYSSVVCLAALVILLAGCAGASLQPATAVVAPQESAANTGRPAAPEPVVQRVPVETQPQPLLLNAEFNTVEDEALDLRRDSALRIRLHTEPAADTPTP